MSNSNMYSINLTYYVHIRIISIYVYMSQSHVNFYSVGFDKCEIKSQKMVPGDMVNYKILYHNTFSHYQNVWWPFFDRPFSVISTGSAHIYIFML